MDTSFDRPPQPHRKPPDASAIRCYDDLFSDPTSGPELGVPGRRKLACKRGGKPDPRRVMSFVRYAAERAGGLDALAEAHGIQIDLLRKWERSGAVRDAVRSRIADLIDAVTAHDH